MFNIKRVHALENVVESLQKSVSRLASQNSDYRIKLHNAECEVVQLRIKLKSIGVFRNAKGQMQSID